MSALVAVTALLVLAACGRDEPRVRSTLQLMDDPVVLQAVLNRCNERGETRDPECRNARDAVRRLEAQQEPEVRQQKQLEAQLEFERAREKRRQLEELERKRQEATQSQEFDPYTMPLVEPMQGAQSSDQANAPVEPPSS